MGNEKIKIWERMKNESEQAYSAFKIFLQMENRTLFAVTEKLRKSDGLIRRWAKKYFWRERADAWDNSILKEERKARIKNRTKAVTRQENLGKLLQQKAVEILQNTNTKKGSFYAATQMIEIGCKLINEAYEFEKADSDNSTVTIKIERANCGGDTDRSQQTS